MPFFEFGYAFVQVSHRLELGILDLLNGDLGQGVCEEDLEIGGKLGKRIITTL